MFVASRDKDSKQASTQYIWDCDSKNSGSEKKAETTVLLPNPTRPPVRRIIFGASGSSIFHISSRYTIRISTCIIPPICLGGRFIYSYLILTRRLYFIELLLYWTYVLCYFVGRFNRIFLVLSSFCISHGQWVINCVGVLS